jgi:1,4-dihydroxy-2-naphthoyl-CoA hydrolase
MGPAALVTSLTEADSQHDGTDGSSVERMSPSPELEDPVVRARWATEFFEPLVPGMLGCAFDHSAKDLVVGHIEVTERLIAGTGFLFAPAVVALADTCAAIGCGNNIPEGASFTTIELKSNFLSSARVGDSVSCRCEPAHLGRQTHVWDATVTNDSTEKLMALFRCTQMVLSPR